MTSWTSNSTILRVVTRDVSLAEQGSIQTLNDLPPWMVEEAREIAREGTRIAAAVYLKFFVKMEGGTEDFVQEVLRDGQDALTWRIRDCLWVLRESDPITRMGIERLHALRGIAGERWFRFAPAATRHPSDDSPGSVGVLGRQLRYWQTRSEIEGVDFVSTNGETIEPVPEDRIENSFRRWIARRLAWWSKDYIANAGAAVATPGILDVVARGEVVTRDAQIAAAALAREARAHGAEADFLRRAGFLGPDAWYEG